MKDKWTKVNNGTDIRGIVIKDDKEITLTDDMVYIISSAFAKWLSLNKNISCEKLKVGVGMDSRITGLDFKKASINGLSKMGCSVFDCGMCSTPAMFMTTVMDEYKFDGSIELTASHLPYYYNGIKFFTDKGAMEKENILEIIDIARDIEKESKYNSNNDTRSVKKIEFMDSYSRHLRNKISEGTGSLGENDKPLSGLKIIVDAGNGVGGFYVDKVLKPLGADTQGSQFIEPDGYFPNHIPNPEKKEAMDSIKNAVIKSNADLGIIFDADVDRAAIVDENGKEINRNRLIALISSIVLKEHPHSIVVTDSVTSTGLKEFIEGLGGVHKRFKRGYKNVIDEGLRLNKCGKKCCLAIETSGHAALKENYFLDDGAYLVSKLIINMVKLKRDDNKKLSSLIENLKEPVESMEFRLKIEKESFKEYGNEVIDKLKDFISDKKGWSVEPVNYEGIRINCDKNSGNGWFLLRLSLHEPVLPLNIESDSENGVELIKNELIPFFKLFDCLKIDSILE